MITNHTPESLIAFEDRIKTHFANGELPCLVHLSGGNERELLGIFQNVKRDDWVFSTHRSHYHALLKGVNPDELESMILDGRSMFVFSREHKFVTSSILGGICGMAVGVAREIKARGGRESVWCFIGDGAEDNGRTYEAIRYAVGHDLPIAFVIEDNDRQVDTSCAERWGTRRRWAWPESHVLRYMYAPTFPHGGAGLTAGSVSFKKEAILRHARMV